DEGEMGRADGVGRRAASIEVASPAAPRLLTGPATAVGRDGGSGSEVAALRSAAGRAGIGSALVWVEGGASWGDLVVGPDSRTESGLEALRFAVAVNGPVETLAWLEAGSTCDDWVDSLKPQKYPLMPATAAASNTPPVSRATAATVGTVERGTTGSGTRSDPSASRERSSTTATSPSKILRRPLRLHGGGSGASVGRPGGSAPAFFGSSFEC